MKKIVCTEEQYNSIYDRIDQMDVLAEEYVPSEEDFVEICENLNEYMLFLIWIDETGVSTEDNQEMRKRINRLIKDYLVIKECDTD
jgi:hypothetical protein